MEIDEHLGRIPSLEPCTHRTPAPHPGEDALRRYGDAAVAWDRRAVMISLLPFPKRRAPLSRAARDGRSVGWRAIRARSDRRSLPSSYERGFVLDSENLAPNPREDAPQSGFREVGLVLPVVQMTRQVDPTAAHAVCRERGGADWERGIRGLKDQDASRSKLLEHLIDHGRGLIEVLDHVPQRDGIDRLIGQHRIESSFWQAVNPRERATDTASASTSTPYAVTDRARAKARKVPIPQPTSSSDRMGPANLSASRNAENTVAHSLAARLGWRRVGICTAPVFAYRGGSVIGGQPRVGSEVLGAAASTAAHQSVAALNDDPKRRSLAEARRAVQVESARPVFRRVETPSLTF
jgi:hypothetical protein